jgi:hypothetical protein
VFLHHSKRLTMSQLGQSRLGGASCRSSHVRNAPLAMVGPKKLLILAHDRPFTGELSVRPDPLLQVMPELESSQQGIKP